LRDDALQFGGSRLSGLEQILHRAPQVAQLHLV
jgi:hypothetical protein